MQKRRINSAAIAAAMAAAILSAAPALSQALVGPRRGPAAAPAPTTKPDTDNTGRPEDPGMPPMPGGMMDQAAAAGMQVYVDDSFESVDKLRSAIRLQRNSQAREAIQAYQQIIDDYGQKLVYLNDKSYVSITDYVRDRLLEMPAVKTGMYDQLFGTQARKAVDAAVGAHDLAGLLRVSDRYYPSKAALDGLSQAADWYFERGEFTAAAETWIKLLKHPLAGSMQADLLFRAATAKSLAGAADPAKALRDRLAKDFPDALGTVSGQQVNLAERLDQILAIPAWDRSLRTGDEWPAFGGGPDRAGLLTTNAEIGARLWSVPLQAPGAGGQAINDDVEEQEQRVFLQRAQLGGQAIIMINGRIAQPAQGDPTSLPSQPVLSNGSLFIHLGNEIMTISANAGTRLWTYPPTPASSGDAVIRNANAVRSMGHDSVSVFGDQVFAMLPTSPGMALQYDGTGMPAFPTRIVCLNRDDGREIWSRAASEIKTDKEGTLTFTGSPLVTRQGVFIMARKGSNNGGGFVQQYLVRLDRATGQPTWACYLCSTNIASIASQGSANVIPVPTLVDDVLYICTGHGADCAVDANVGRILWLRIGGKQNGSATYTAPWKFNAPVVVGDKLLVDDSGAVLRVYNRWSGKLLHEYTATDLQGSGMLSSANIDVLAGAVGSKVFLSMGTVSICYEESELEKDNPQPVWREQIAGAGKPVGRPFLTQTAYYVPFDQQLVRFDLGGNYKPVDWPQDEKGQAGRPGNLLVTSEQVIVVNDNEVAGYAKWETARDIRLEKIRQNPRDPAAYLSLAEVAFRTGNTDIAQQNMKSAVDLANAGNAPPGSAVADILDRLYRTNLAFAEQLLTKKDNDTRDSARFYFEQCRAAARTPEQQAEWRLRLAELSLKQKKPDEAVALYSEVLADPAVRVAGYREGDIQQSAGAAAEQRIGVLQQNDPAVYKRFEDQAAATTQRAAGAHDTAALQQVIDAFPNSQTSTKAAAILAALYMDKSEWENARRVLFWLQPRVKDDGHARALADLAKVNLELKKPDAAKGWAARGVRQYPNFSWTDAGKKMTFAILHDQILSAGHASEGRFPKWNGDAAHPALDYVVKADNPQTVSLRDQTKAQLSSNGQLLAPVETAGGLRSPNLLFLREANRLRVYDTDKGDFVVDHATLPHDADAVLLGVAGDSAGLLQFDKLIVLNVKTSAIQARDLPAMTGTRAPGAVIRENNLPRVQQLPNSSQVEQIGDIIYVNGSPFAQAGTVTLIDENGVPFLGRAGNDPGSIRRAAFRPLGNQVHFTSASLLNNKAYVLGDGQLDAYSATDGSPAWVSREGAKITANLPAGDATCLVGNEDLVVVQVDSPDGKTSTFCAFDGETGRAGRQLKLDADHALWRALGDDGTLYVVTTQGVAAYDMMSDTGGVLWQKGHIGVRYAAATALTLDGLVVVSDEGQVQSLKLESGEPLWTGTMPSDLTSGPNSAATLHSIVVPPPDDEGRHRKVNGDLVVFQSADGAAALQSTVVDPKDGPPDNPQLLWEVTKSPGLPPRQSLEFFDRLFIEQMSGQAGSAARLVAFGARDLSGGNIRFNISLAEGDSPLLAWQTLDNGIAVDVGTPANGQAGRVYFIRNKQP